MAAKYSLATRIKLANGQSIPQIHLGLYMMDGSEVQSAVHTALAAGYRGFDSAQMYHNEAAAGNAILTFLSDPKLNKANLQRSDITFTSKLASNGSYDATRKSIAKSVETCGLGYIDLFLLHSPYGGTKARLESWKAVEDAVDNGEVKIGGVSNFGVKHIQELVGSKPRTIPQVNQIEVHPFNTRKSIRNECAKHNIAVQAYGPLARALRMTHPTIVKLAQKYACSTGQLMVRWSVQHGLIPLPKSARKERIVENADIGGFEISTDDMAVLDRLDEYLVTDWDPVDCA